MKDSELLSLCNERLNYNPDTGVFTWIVSIRGARLTGIAGNKNSLNYITIGINGKNLYAHRLAFLITYGYMPKFVDHKDMVRDHNWIDNLRAATKTQNNANSGPQKNNTSGYKGVILIKGRGKWKAEISINNKNKWIGSFKCKHEAAKAYNNAAKDLHGEFAYQNIIKG